MSGAVIETSGTCAPNLARVMMTAMELDGMRANERLAARKRRAVPA